MKKFIEEINNNWYDFDFLIENLRIKDFNILQNSSNVEFDMSLNTKMTQSLTMTFKKRIFIIKLGIQSCVLRFKRINQGNTPYP